MPEPKPVPAALVGLPMRANLTALAQQRGLTHEELAERANAHYPERDPITGKELARLDGRRIRIVASGDRPYTKEILEAVAAALEVDPDVFAEYRLLQARRLFDERVLGMDVALTNANRLARLLAEGSFPRPANATAPTSPGTRRYRRRPRQKSR